MGMAYHLPRLIGIELVRGDGSSRRTDPSAPDAPEGRGPRRFLPASMLEGLAEEIDRWPSIEVVRLVRSGEPLLHPEYRKCLEALARSRVASRARVIQETHAGLLTGEAAEAILAAGLIKELVVSLERPDDEDGGAFEQALRNVRDFAEEARNRRPDLLVSTSATRPRPGDPSIAEASEPGEASRRWHDLRMARDARVEPHPASGEGGPRVFGGCPFVEGDELYFTVDGWARPCCVVQDERFRVGNLSDSGFGDLLNDPPMRQVRRSLRLDRRDDLPFCGNCHLSLGGGLEPGELREFWKRRDDLGLIDDQEERGHLFSRVAPAPHRHVRIDLGCGATKLPGFVGVDRFPLPGVDVVADLDRPLPFADDCCDLLYASHSLEHIRDLPKVMREVYRVCKHGAQVCIVAPYFNQALNLANPYHKQVFNEHTPRFWTAWTDTPIDPADFAHPHAAAWGLLDSDHSARDIDIRCVKMEFFYFPAYRAMPEEMRRRHRQHEQDVCDQIVYHLIVWKPRDTEVEAPPMTNPIDFLESPYVAMRRVQERCELLEDALRLATERGQKLEADYRVAYACKDQLLAELQEVVRYRDQVLADLREVVAYKDRLQADLREVADCRDRVLVDLQEVVAYKDRLQADLDEANIGKDRLRADLGEVTGDRDRLQADLREARGSQDRLRADLDEAGARRERLEADRREATLRNEELGRDLGLRDEANAILRQALDASGREAMELREAVMRLEASREEQALLLQAFSEHPDWQVLQAMRRFVSAVAPPNTVRRRVVGSLAALPRSIASRAHPGHVGPPHARLRMGTDERDAAGTALAPGRDEVAD